MLVVEMALYWTSRLRVRAEGISNQTPRWLGFHRKFMGTNGYFGEVLCPSSYNRPMDP